MKHIFLSCLIFVISLSAISAQQNHFLYFQTEAKQPFYVKLNDKVFNSSSAGYLIIPKLTDGNYKIVFGFPKKEWPEQAVSYSLEKDAGFLLKNFPDKGWGLFNLQSLSISMSGNEPGNEVVQAGNSAGQVNKDDFSAMLADVVNDSTIKQQDLPASKGVGEVTKVKIADTIETSKGVGLADQTTPVAYNIANSVITKNLQKKNDDGVDMIYIDEYNNVKDTIRIFIPADKSIEKPGDKPAEPATANEAVADNNIDTVNTQKPPVSNPEPPLPEQTPVQEQVDTAKVAAKESKVEFLPATSGVINSNCNQYATEDDFLKLRKRMAAENNDDDMIRAAKKVFRSKCFTTNYIKNLSALFLNEEGKYNFFDAAYPFVSDSDIFYTLENQLSDAYYIKRFKAMIHQ